MVLIPDITSFQTTDGERTTVEATKKLAAVPINVHPKADDENWLLVVAADAAASSSSSSCSFNRLAKSESFSFDDSPSLPPRGIEASFSLSVTFVVSGLTKRGLDSELDRSDGRIRETRADLVGYL